MRFTIRDDSGKKKTVSIDSGVKHNPAPSTPRGMRRKAKREGKGGSK